MNKVFENLSWLPKADDDWTTQLNMAQSLKKLSELSNFSLDDMQLKRLYRKYNQLKLNQLDIEPLIPISIGIISNSTYSLILPALVATGLRYGFIFNIIESGYGQIAQEAFTTDSIFSGKKLNAILLAIDYRGLPFIPSPGDITKSKKDVDEYLSLTKSIIEGLRKKTGAEVVIQTIAPPAENIFGSYEGIVPGTLSWMISRLNHKMGSLMGDGAYILDVCGLAARIGLEDWHDPKLWNLAKLPFSQKYTPIYSEFFCRILASRYGKSRRCLILDLDNTLWGGIIGDDGVEGILIGNGDPIAEAHLSVQATALELRGRGVALAISSKNEDITARQPFKTHPDMLLREMHIAVFQANWSDKASNIKAIAQTLSLGLGSMVFLDDNPAERMQVRRELPEVAVPELPNDPALYTRTLLAAGYFEATAFSEEDKKRADFYKGNAERTELLSRSSDMDAYLHSLKMVISFKSFDKVGRARIAQLINKSNQFNLTSKRYSELEISSLEEDEKYFTRQIRLKDVLGDNGMISVVICKKNGTVWEIDTWLMSCRVLGRCVEIAVLQDVVSNAIEQGAKELIGFYIPTERNVIVKDHYKKLGFNKASEEANREVWNLNLLDYKFLQIPMTIEV